MIRSSVIAAVVIILLACAWTALAQGGDYDLSWFSLTGGGASQSTDGRYSLNGAFGQPAANTSYAREGNFALASGFMAGIAPPSGGSGSLKVFFPAVINNANRR